MQVYQIEVQRGAAPEKEKIFRRYREFDELHRKLEQCFPDIELPQLPGKIFVPGKSHTKQVHKESAHFSIHNLMKISLCILSSSNAIPWPHCVTQMSKSNLCSN